MVVRQDKGQRGDQGISRERRHKRKVTLLLHDGNCCDLALHSAQTHNVRV